MKTSNRQATIGNSAKATLFGLGLWTLFFVQWVEAQEAKKIPRIGFLVVRTLESQSTRLEAFRQGLAELGYKEGLSRPTRFGTQGK